MKRNPISYSLWFMPNNAQRFILEDMINRLAEEHGGPRFQPHVTLLSSIIGDEEVLLKSTKSLSKSLKSFIITFSRSNKWR